MSHVFISYARSTARQAQQVAAMLRGLGHQVWLDDAIPAHRAYADVIEERLRRRGRRRHLVGRRREVRVGTFRG
ncbi:MAG: toll/interleukin-1 receptor domain-containing protein [Proteobacteria bacterium]|nr:toll/interleukin-1 receptor domain-containing protein [Pseudomonadota bacterium]